MPAPTKKRSRKPAKNPRIEEVLLMKDKWNDQVSHLIYDIIALKRGLNGRGDSEHGLPPSRITEKLNPGVSSLLKEISSKFNEISNLGLEIIKNQDQRSEEHASKKSAGISPSLISEGTNPFSRALLRLKSPFKNDAFKTLLGIHSCFLDLKFEVEEMQDASVTSGEEGRRRLVDSYDKFHQLLIKINSLYNEYLVQTGKKDEQATSSESGFSSELLFYKKEFLLADSIESTPHKWKMRFASLVRAFEQSNEVERPDLLNKIKELYQDLLTYYKQNYDLEKPGDWKTISEFFERKPIPLTDHRKHKKNLAEILQPFVKEFQIASSIPNTPGTFRSRFLSLVKGYENSPEEDTANLLEKVKILYAELLKFYRSNYTFTGPWTTVDEMFHQNPKYISIDDMEELMMKAEDGITVLAHNLVSRFLKKKKIQLSLSGDPLAGVRINLFDVLGKIREDVISVMDEIEGNPNGLEIGQNIKDMKRSFDEVRRLVSLLKK